MILVAGMASYGSVLTHLGEEIVYARSLRSISRQEIPVDKISLVMFTGGEDVSPVLYGGEDPDGLSGINTARDAAEIEIFEEFHRRGIKLTGICRGFQFINVMAGGEMYQHIFGHAGLVHSVYYTATKHISEVMSTHHQLVKLDDKAIPVAWSAPSLSHGYWGPKGKILMEKPIYEMESAIFPHINAFGVQYHPEMMREETEGRRYYQKVIADFYHMDLGAFTSIYGGTYERGHFKTTSATG